MLLLTVSLSASAQKTTPNISEWTENTSFGKNGANLTADGYSLWDGHSRQKYSFNSEGDIEICNAAQLARYAYDKQFHGLHVSGQFQYGLFFQVLHFSQFTVTTVTWSQL